MLVAHKLAGNLSDFDLLSSEIDTVISLVRLQKINNFKLGEILDMEYYPLTLPIRLSDLWSIARTTAIKYLEKEKPSHFALRTLRAYSDPITELPEKPHHYVVH